MAVLLPLHFLQGLDASLESAGVFPFVVHLGLQFRPSKRKTSTFSLLMSYPLAGLGAGMVKGVEEVLATAGAGTGPARTGPDGTLAEKLVDDEADADAADAGVPPNTTAGRAAGPGRLGVVERGGMGVAGEKMLLKATAALAAAAAVGAVLGWSRCLTRAMRSCG